MKTQDFSAAPFEVLLPSTRAATRPGVARLRALAPPSWRRRRREIEVAGMRDTESQAGRCERWRGGMARQGVFESNRFHSGSQGKRGNEPQAAAVVAVAANRWLPVPRRV